MNHTIKHLKNGDFEVQPIRPSKEGSKVNKDQRDALEVGGIGIVIAVVLLVVMSINFPA